MSRGPSSRAEDQSPTAHIIEDVSRAEASTLVLDSLMESGRRMRWAGVGALGSAGAIAATVFCCLPFATGILGAGVAAAGAQLAPFQPYLAGLSLGLLGYAMYQVYRPGSVTCVGGRCAVPSSLHYRRVTAWVMTVAVVLMLTVSWWANWVIYWML